MISVVVQAGGRSSRMGRDKALVDLAGKPLIQYVLERVADLGDEVLITTNTQDAYAFLGYRMASDETPGVGALEGFKTALEAARGDVVLLVACDMPFVKRDLLHYMLEQIDSSDIVIPRWDDRYQPLHAVYRREPCLRAVNDALDRGEKRMVSFHKDVRVLEISETDVAQHSPDGLSFFNINTPDDLAYAESLLG